MPLLLERCWTGTKQETSFELVLLFRKQCQGRSKPWGYRSHFSKSLSDAWHRWMMASTHATHVPTALGQIRSSGRQGLPCQDMDVWRMHT